MNPELNEINDDDDEYVPNPALALLAEELKIYNEILIEQNIPDSVRLFRLRDFAQCSRSISRITFPQLEQIEDETEGYKWNVTFLNESLGSFANPTQAYSAFRQAHINHFGIESEYHPNHPIDVSHIYEDKCPVGVQVTGSGKYKATIVVDYKQINLGTHDTIENAIEARNKAVAEVDSSNVIKQSRIKAKELSANITELPAGVRREPSGRFLAQINNNYKVQYLGIYDAVDEAHDAFKRAHVDIHGSTSRYYDEQMKDAA